jgi:hypothetical protein
LIHYDKLRKADEKIPSGAGRTGATPVPAPENTAVERGDVVTASKQADLHDEMPKI